MIRVVIIEDESIIARNLRKMIEEADPSIQVEAVLPTVSGSLEWLRNNPAPDLIFSDIQLADGISFSIFEKHPINCAVIFITAYDEYAIRAFKLNSIHYLMKPVSPGEIAEAIQRFRKWSGLQPGYGEQVNNLIADLKTPAVKRYKTRFMAHFMKSIVPIPEEQVSCFHKDQLIYLVTRDGKELITDYHTLEELEELIDPARFFRANRQHIIHIDAISRFRTSSTGKITIDLATPTATEIDVSREKAPAFRAWIA